MSNKTLSPAASGVILSRDEILKHATARPWHYQEESDAYTHIARGLNSRLLFSGPQNTSEQAEADIRLAVLAVNSYEAREALIADLVTALEHTANLLKFEGYNDGVIDSVLIAAKKVQP